MKFLRSPPAAGDAAALQPVPKMPGKRFGAAKLAGPSFEEQEPDLAKEAGLTAREVSGWAAAASGLPE